MKIKLLLLACCISCFSEAQNLAGNWYFDASAGAAQTFGKMTKANPGNLIYNGSWSLNLGFTKYSEKGQFFNSDVLGYQFGYAFHVNKLDASDLNRMNPEPASYKIHQGTQLLHGPYFRMEYSRSGAFAPYFGLGAYLLALRGASFDVKYNPEDNFYTQSNYEDSGWGRLNASFSAFGGLRLVMPNDWTLSLNYEIFLRDSWNAKYNVIGLPATSDLPVTEDSFILTQLGWNQHIELRLQIPMR